MLVLFLVLHLEQSGLLLVRLGWCLIVLLMLGWRVADFLAVAAVGVHLLMLSFTANVYFLRLCCCRGAAAPSRRLDRRVALGRGPSRRLLQVQLLHFLLLVLIGHVS